MNDINKILIDYLQFCKTQKNLSNKTISAYVTDITQFIVYVANGNYTEKSIVTNYITHLHGRFGSKSVKRKIASIASLAFCYSPCSFNTKS